MPTTEKFKLHNVYGCLINRKRRCHFKCILQELVNVRVVIHQCILIALEISIDFKIELLVRLFVWLHFYLDYHKKLKWRNNECKCTNPRTYIYIYIYIRPWLTVFRLNLVHSIWIKSQWCGWGLWSFNNLSCNDSIYRPI